MPIEHRFDDFAIELRRVLRDGRDQAALQEEVRVDVEHDPAKRDYPLRGNLDRADGADAPELKRVSRRSTLVVSALAGLTLVMGVESV